MKKSSENKSHLNRDIHVTNSELLELEIQKEKKIYNNVISIRLTNDGPIIKEESQINKDQNENSTEGKTMDKLSGIYFEGIQYYDLSGVHFINNAGVAILIDLLKSILELGVEVQFVNVDEKIKIKIKELGLDHVINCKEKIKVETKILL